MTRIDWPGLMRAGIGGLKLLPADFWALMPAELSLLLGLDAEGPSVLNRSRLEELSRLYPDKSMKWRKDGQS